MIEFDRPWALASLLVPFLVALLALQARRAPRASTGTLEVWRQLPPDAARAPARRTRPPWSALLLVAALCAACLALAGPRAPLSSAARWTVLIDRSPSMYARSEGRTALERALSTLEPLLEGPREYRSVAGEFVSAPLDRVPPEWLERPAGDWDEPAWERLDEPGLVWVTDAPAASRKAASLALAGSAQGATSDLMDRSGVYVASELEGTPFGELVLAWMEGRGVERAESASGALLAVVAAGQGPAREVTCAGEGWRVVGRVQALEPVLDEPSASWLECDGASVVRARPGRIEVAWEGVPRLAGEDVEFALEFSRRLDRAATERVDPARSGEAACELLAPAAPQQRPRSHVPWLASLAALLALGSLAVRR